MRAFKVHTILLVIVLFAGCSPDEMVVNENEQPQVIDSVPQSDSIPSHDDTDTTEVFGPNILRDGGIEDWVSIIGYPNIWSTNDSRDVSQNRIIICEGLSSAKMKSRESGITARIKQSIPITPGSRIRIRFKYYIEQWKTNGARTYCYFRTGAAQSTNISISELKEFYTDDEYYIFRGGGYGKAYLPHTLNTWLTFDETLTVPPTATHFEFGINSYHGTTIYIDDCYIGEAIE